MQREPVKLTFTNFILSYDPRNMLLCSGEPQSPPTPTHITSAQNCGSLQKIAFNLYDHSFAICNFCRTWQCTQIWHALKYKTESTLFVNSLNSLTEALANYNIYSEHSKLLFGEANQLALFDSCPSSLQLMQVDASEKGMGWMI